jgi:hypothetical protein
MKLKSNSHLNLKAILLMPVLCVLNIQIAISQQIKNKRWIGLEYNYINEVPFFKTNSLRVSRAVSNNSYVVSDYIQGGRHYVFLEKYLSTRSKHFKIVQALDLGKLLDKEQVNISGLCKKDGKADEYIIAIVKIETNMDTLKNIRKAWRIDPKKGLFTPEDPKKISCINEGEL